jgi:aminopeptidase N
VNHQLRFLLAHHPQAYEVDRTAGANAIRQPLENLREAGTLYGPIIYQKAPVVMRQLELRVGEETFRDGLRTYLERFSYGNATWPELIAILDERSPEDLAAWSRVWVEEPGRPRVTVEPHVVDGVLERVVLRHEDPMGRGRLWPQRLELAVGAGGTVRRAEVDLAGDSLVVTELGGTPAPDFVLPTAAGTEYGHFVLDEGSLAWLSRSLPELEDPLLRGSAWVLVWDAVLDGRVEPEAFVELALRGLERERVELVVQRLLGYLGGAYWRLLLPEQRIAWAPRVERALWEGATGSGPVTVRSAFLSSWRGVALTAEGTARLERLWSGEEPAPVPLSETDRTEMASTLAVREVEGAQAILDRARAEIENPDRLARFDFVRPSLSSDPAERERFFQTLLDPANRAREPWVLSALSNLSHPLRQEHAQRFLLPALEELEEIQRTGDIFFPDRWLDAALGGHNTPEAARVAREFLETRPDFPARLRAKVLQAADGLFRAAEITRGDAASADAIRPSAGPGSD